MVITYLLKCTIPFATIGAAPYSTEIHCTLVPVYFIVDTEAAPTITYRCMQNSMCGPRAQVEEWPFTY